MGAARHVCMITIIFRLSTFAYRNSVFILFHFIFRRLTISSGDREKYRTFLLNGRRHWMAVRTQFSPSSSFSLVLFSILIIVTLQ